MAHLYTWPLSEKRKSILAQLKKIPDAAGKDTSNLIEIALEEYIKHHGSGNPAYKLDNWKDPDFKPYPTLAASYDIWWQYVYKLTPKELKELKGHIIKLDNAFSRRIRERK